MNTDKQHQKRTVVLTIVFSILLLLSFAFMYYNSYQTYIDSEQKVTASHFSEIVTGDVVLVRNYIGRLSDNTKSTARMLARIDPDEASLTSFFKEQLPITSAEAAIVVGADGKALYDSAEHLRFHRQRKENKHTSGLNSDDAYSAVFSDSIQKASELTGNCVVSPLRDCSDGASRFCVAVPLKLQNNIRAVLALIYPQFVLNELIDTAPANETAQLCIMDSNGSFVATQTMQTPWAKSGQFLIDSETSNRLMTITSGLDGKKYVVYAKAIDINDCFVVYVIPKSILDAQIQAGCNRIHIFGIVCILFGVLVFGIGAYRNRIRYYHLQLFKEKFRIATLQSARAAFEYDRKKDSLRLISECEHIRLPKPSLSLSELPTYVHPTDRLAYGQSVLELRRDGTTSTTIRLIHFANEDAYCWYHVTATRLTDKRNGSALTIGTLEDIDEREQERLMLAEKATKDSLTGLCNRAETEQAIRKRLADLDPDDHSVFAILDLDDFKQINDVYGHECGDRALLFFADKLRATFRFGDLIGRLGGDEFIVYMTLTSDKKVLQRRIQELMDSLKMSRSDDVDLPAITCSVGCCIASRSNTFEELYKTADTALYESKTKGKGLATIA